MIGFSENPLPSPNLDAGANGNGLLASRSPTNETTTFPQTPEGGRYPITSEIISVLNLSPGDVTRNSEKKIIYEFALKKLYELLIRAGLIKPSVNFATFKQRSKEAGFRTVKKRYLKTEYEIAETVFISTSKPLPTTEKLQQLEQATKIITKLEMKIQHTNNPQLLADLQKQQALKRGLESALARDKQVFTTYTVHLLSLFTNVPLIEIGEPKTVSLNNGSALPKPSSDDRQPTSTGYNVLSRSNGTPITPANGTVENLIYSGGRAPNQRVSSEVIDTSPNTQLEAARLIQMNTNGQTITEDYFELPHILANSRLPILIDQQPSVEGGKNLSPRLNRLIRALNWIFSEVK